MSEVEKPSISVSPNPATDMVKITSSKDLGTVTLFNMNGQVVKQQSIGGTVGVLDISELSNGVYTLRATANDASYTFKVVKN